MDKSQSRSNSPGSEHTRAPTAPALDPDDLRKPGRGAEFGDFMTDTVKRGSQMAAESVGGTAQAVGRGFREFGDSLTSDNLTRVSLSNGFVTGLASGYAVFFEEMAASARRVLQHAESSSEMAGPSKPGTREQRAADELDYDRLATLIAEKLRPRQP
jgi:hypothetical protein